ncbi:hypothetical protein VPH35_063623 [Triticum aestivum]
MKLTRAYVHAAAESYKAEIRAVDFAKVSVFILEDQGEINEWAAAATNNLISEILPEGSLSDNSRFMLTNAIYFKGVWKSRFPKDLTVNRKFHRLGGAAAIKVPFMTFAPGKHELFLPYKTGHASAPTSRYSMCVFLPHERDGLPAMVDALEAAGGSLLDHVPKYPCSVSKLLLPKFKLSFFCRLAQLLESMGVRQAFSEEEADLSGLVKKSVCDVRLDEVFHKAVVEVNEEGTKAAACTAVVGVRKYSGKTIRREFVADHPFAFYIVEEVSGAVVFACHVLDPSSP